MKTLFLILTIIFTAFSAFTIIYCAILSVKLKRRNQRLILHEYMRNPEYIEHGTIIRPLPNEEVSFYYRQVIPKIILFLILNIIIYSIYFYL